MKKILLSLSFMFSCLFSYGQEILSWELVQTVPLSVMQANYGFLMQTGVEHYRVTYSTTGTDGEPDVASGLVTVPADKTFAYPICIHQHGTVGSREEVPSNLSGGYQIGEVMGGINMIALSPDYLGLGTSRGQHPYVHADTESSAAIDLMIAFQKYAETVSISYNDQIFLTGYSQGGHASMAAHRELESEYAGTYNVSGAAHLSGPYSISEKMVEATLGDQEYNFVAYLANVALSMQEAYPEIRENYNLDNVFLAQYIPAIVQFQNEEIDLFELNDILINLLIQNVGTSTSKDLLLPEILDALKNDPTHPLSMALAEQDVYDWAPNAPTRIYYCMSDDQVFFENGELALEVMNANGAPDVDGTDVGPDLDHGGCVTPALINTVLFFVGLREVTSSVVDINGQQKYSLRTSMVSDHLMVERSMDVSDSEAYMILDFNGRVLSRGVISQAETFIDLRNASSGHYLIRFDNGREIHRFFKM